MKVEPNIIHALLLGTTSSYPLFAEYCKNLDLGLRKNALKYLDEFLEDITSWDYDTKATFCKVIFNISTSPKAVLDMYLKTSLAENLIKPTLIEMSVREPNNFLPFKWYGQYFDDDPKFIKRAYDLNPTDNTIQIILLQRLEHSIWFSTHHLPDGYIGNIEDDEEDIKLAFSVLVNFDNKTRTDYLATFAEYQSEIDNYKVTKNSPSR